MTTNVTFPAYLTVLVYHQPKPSCDRVYSRMSFAIPLEIVFMTPLLSWNPHDLPEVQVSTRENNNYNPNYNPNAYSTQRTKRMKGKITEIAESWSLIVIG